MRDFALEIGNSIWIPWRRKISGMRKTKIPHVYSLAFLYGDSIFSEGFSTSSKVNIGNQRTRTSTNVVFKIRKVPH